MESPLVRLMSKVRKTDTCWLWTGRVFDHGYGDFFLRGRKTTAHRAMWILTKGDPGDLYVLHTCDNPLCVRIDHLFLGTHLDNMKDKVLKGRQSRLIGENNPSSKLHETTVALIREDLRLGRTQQVIAEKYGISQSLVSRIKLGKVWK